MAKRQAKGEGSDAAAASDSGAGAAAQGVPEAGAAEGVSGDYEGKQHYPKALYGKYPDGTVVAEKVLDRAHHDRLLAESPAMGWADSPADHGLETAPAGVPVEPVKHAGIVGKVG